MYISDEDEEHEIAEKSSSDPDTLNKRSANTPIKETGEKLSELERLKIIVQTLDADNSKLKKENELLKTEIEKLNNAPQDRGSNTENVNLLNRKLEEMSKIQKEKDEQLAEFKIEAQLLKQQIGAYTSQILSQEKLTKSVGNTQELENQVIMLKEQLEFMTTSANESKLGKVQAEKENKELKAETQRLNNLLEESNRRAKESTENQSSVQQREASFQERQRSLQQQERLLQEDKAKVLKDTTALQYKENELKENEKLQQQEKVKLDEKERSLQEREKSLDDKLKSFQDSTQQEFQANEQYSQKLASLQEKEKHILQKEQTLLEKAELLQQRESTLQSATEKIIKDTKEKELAISKSLQDEREKLNQYKIMQEDSLRKREIALQEKRKISSRTGSITTGRKSKTPTDKRANFT